MKKIIIWCVAVSVVVATFLMTSGVGGVKCVETNKDMSVNKIEAIEAKCNEVIKQNAEKYDVIEQKKKPLIEEQNELSKQNDEYRAILSKSVFKKAPQQEQAKLSDNKRLSKTKNLHLVK